MGSSRAVTFRPRAARGGSLRRSGRSGAQTPRPGGASATARGRVTLRPAAGLLLAVLVASGEAAAGSGPAAARTPSPSEVVEALLTASGAEGQLPGIRRRVLAELERQASASGDPAGAALRERVARAYAPEALLRDLRSELLYRFEPSHAAAALAWYRSPLGARVAALERAAAGPSGAAALEAWREAVEADPPGPARMELLARIEAASRATEFAVALALDTTAGLYEGLHRVGGGGADGAESPEAFRRALEARRPALEEGFRRQVQGFLLFAYRDLSDEELGRLVAFLESDGGRWFTAAYNESLRAALRRGARRLLSPEGEAVSTGQSSDAEGSGAAGSRR